jgi:Bacterial PH domain
MVNLSLVEEQLRAIGCNYRFWGRPEIRELAKLLMPNEIIKQCVNGRYEGGFATLCVTDHRLLLLDRKPMFFSMEDIRFDMISEIDYNTRLVEGAIHIITPNRKLTFISWSQHRLRELLNYTQQKVIEIRQHYLMQHQFQQQQMMLNPQEAAGMVGGLAMQGNNGFGQPNMPLNPYAKVPLLTRRRRYPKFY